MWYPFLLISRQAALTVRMRPVETAASRERCNLGSMFRAAHGFLYLRASSGAKTNDSREVLAKIQPERESNCLDSRATPA
jgi:hypothetical protein